MRGRALVELLLTSVKNAENHGIRSLIRKMTSTAERHAKATNLLYSPKKWSSVRVLECMLDKARTGRCHRVAGSSEPGSKTNKEL